MDVSSIAELIEERARLEQMLRTLQEGAEVPGNPESDERQRSFLRHRLFDLGQQIAAEEKAARSP